jgi:hypothetical protein
MALLLLLPLCRQAHFQLRPSLLVPHLLLRLLLLWSLSDEELLWLVPLLLGCTLLLALSMLNTLSALTAGTTINNHCNGVTSTEMVTSRTERQLLPIVE